MTLHISTLSAMVACQVSDRLLTQSRGGTVANWDVNANKNIVLLARDALLTVGYSGIAHIAGRDTDRWLLESMLGVDLDTARVTVQGLSVTQPEATEVASSLASRMAQPVFLPGLPAREWPHSLAVIQRLQVSLRAWAAANKTASISVQVVGWTWRRRYVRGSGQTAAHVARAASDRVTVYLAEPTRLPRRADPRLFRPRALEIRAIRGRVSIAAGPQWGRDWGHGQTFISSIGQPVPEQVLEGVRAALGAGIDQCDRDIANLLTRAVRDVALSNPTVGKDCVSVQLFPGAPPHVVIEYRPATAAAAPAYSPWVATPGAIMAPARFAVESRLDVGGLGVLVLGAVAEDNAPFVDVSPHIRRRPPAST